MSTTTKEQNNHQGFFIGLIVWGSIFLLISFYGAYNSIKRGHDDMFIPIFVTVLLSILCIVVGAIALSNPTMGRYPNQ